MITIQVPATTANLGPGFDSCGLALNLYLTLEVGQEQAVWQIDHQLGESIPTDESNLIIQTALSIVSTLTPRKLRMKSEIPSTRGLGSSSAAIVAGIELANQVAQLNLTSMEKLEIAATIEGHPDNVAPAIMGDFVVASQLGKEIFAVKYPFPETSLLAVIPNHELLTKESRTVLPQTLTYSEAVKASSISNVMISAVLSGDLDLAGQMMARDLWHEIYRKELVPHLSPIRKLADANGAYGTFLSGAGPTVLVLLSKDRLKEMKLLLQEKFKKAVVKELTIDRLGVQAKKQ